MANKWKLLGSAPDMASMRGVVRDFYCEDKELREFGDNAPRVWSVHKADGKQIPNVRIVQPKVDGRYRFEAYGDWQ